MLSMRLKSIVAVSFEVIFAVACAAAQPANSSANLKLTLEAVSANGRVGDLKLRVLLEHDGTPCLPAYIDPFFSPFMLEGRGTARLVFEVVGPTGERITPETQLQPDTVRLTPDRLLLLDCGSIYGRDIHLDRSFWRYKLKPGEYKITARLELDALRGIDLTASVKSQLASRVGVKARKVWLLFPKGLFVSNAVTLNVSL